ncbi:MAG: ribonuclease P protein component [Candidatus Liptonbacteria bacterium]|nr:ribonuclease P protein component [Candidatus Liptonbacteria bacterium]
MKFRDNGLSHNRFAILISNHSEKSAVRRHFWKRRFLDQLKSWPDLGKDFLVITSSKIKSFTPDNLKIELQKVLEKLK